MLVSRHLLILLLASALSGLPLPIAAQSPPQPAPQQTPAQRPEIPLEPIPDSRCPNPDANGNYHVGCGVTAPEVIYRVPPALPDPGKAIDATTVIHVIVDAAGNPTDLSVFRSASLTLNKRNAKLGPAFDKNALDAVAQYRFKPANFHGKPVPVPVNLEIHFQIF